MKILFLLCALLWSSIVWGQKCACNQNPELKDVISCKPIKFNNHSKLLWSYNCNSSWLTFISPSGNKKIIFSLGNGLVDLTNRLGYVDFTEFDSIFLVANNVISGCCDPQDYFVYHKTSGNLVKYIGRAIFVSDDKKYPFVVSITNSKYHTALKTDYESLTIYNLDNRKEYKIALPKGEIEKGMKNNGFTFPENVFETPDLKDSILILKYSIDNYQNTKNLSYKTVEIDLRKYSR